MEGTRSSFSGMQFRHSFGTGTMGLFTGESDVTSRTHAEGLRP